jgi:hypothetical protein
MHVIHSGCALSGAKNPRSRPQWRSKTRRESEADFRRARLKDRRTIYRSFRALLEESLTTECLLKEDAGSTDRTIPNSLLDRFYPVFAWRENYE